MSRVVVTSSLMAITTSSNLPDDIVQAEDCWTDIEDCKKKGVSAPIVLFAKRMSICVALEQFEYNCVTPDWVIRHCIDVN